MIPSIGFVCDSITINYWVYLHASNRNSFTLNIIFKISTLSLFISSFSLVCCVFFLHTSFPVLGELLLCCCGWFDRGALTRWFVCNLWLSSWWVFQCNCGGGKFFHLQLKVESVQIRNKHIDWQFVWNLWIDNPYKI